MGERIKNDVLQVKDAKNPGKSSYTNQQRHHHQSATACCDAMSIATVLFE
jgi:hypothetical protein